MTPPSQAATLAPVSGTGQTVSGPLTDLVADDIISVSVLWPTTPESITSWVGQIIDVNGVPTLGTLWHLVQNIPDAKEATELWTTVLAGSDVLTQRLQGCKQCSPARSRANRGSSHQRRRIEGGTRSL